jgi:ectoine hydroxylase-related dioxygenase (phytanoyl-CoA dioxygenase family)
MAERARAGMSPEALDGLARAFTRDGYVIVEDVLSPAQLRVLRAECDAVTRRYARLGGHPEPRRRDSSAPPEEEEEVAEPCDASLEWLSRDFGCILEVPGCCGCCPPPDPRVGGYRSEACAVTRAAVDATLAPDGPLGALARALLSGSVASSSSSEFGVSRETGIGTGTGTDDVCLFNDQYIVKPPSSADARFAWHRDSQWCDDATIVAAAGNSRHVRRVPYVSLWTALDDTDATNGCVRVMPYPPATDKAVRTRHKRRRVDDADADECINDAHFAASSRYAHDANRLNVLSDLRWRENLTATERKNAAEAFRTVRVCAVRAGTVLCMSDRVMHCSGPNASRGIRRAYMPQFSRRAVLKKNGETVALAVPVNDIRA